HPSDTNVFTMKMEILLEPASNKLLVGSPGVVVYGYDGLLMHPVDPPSPDYVPGPEEPEQAPLSPDYPYAADTSPIALSLGYITDSDLEEDPEDESEDGPADYPADEGDDDDDLSGDDVDDEDEEEASKEDEEEEEEHLAPTDSIAISPIVDLVPSAEETNLQLLFARSQVPIPFPSEAEVDRLFALPTPPPSPLTPLSLPLPQIPSPPTHTSPTYAEAPLGFRAARIRLRAASPPLPPPVNHREEVLEADLLPQKRLCLTTPTPSATVYYELQAYRAHTQIQDLRFAGDIDSDLGCSGFITIEPADSSSRSDSGTTDLKKMPPRKGTRTTPATATATTTTLMTDPAITALIAQGVANALAGRTIQRNTNLNNDGSQGFRSGIMRHVRPTRECTYSDFLRCQPLNFKGTEGVVGLTQWFKRMETVFHISNCVVENQVQFATCTLHDVALRWWNSHVKTVGHDAAYDMALENTYEMDYIKSDVVEKYVGGLPDMIQGNVMSTKPKTMEEANERQTI
ncbi:hypothetical protein Tco_0619421, partial [Tanacetum coccineum]